MKKASALLFIFLAGCEILPQPADLILTGGVIWTGASTTDTASAIAIRHGRIVHLGSDDEVREYMGTQTREIALNGRLITPGFIDNHTHFISGGFQLSGVDLRSARTPREFVRALGGYAQSLPAGRWITGGDWDHEAWPDAPLPRREWIDSVTPSHPVSVNRLDGHMVLVNSRALQLAGITKATRDPPDGTIVRDARTGEPTGVLKDGAMALVDRVIPVAADAEQDEAFRSAQGHALSQGVTMIHDMGTWNSLATFRRARARGELQMRVYSLVPLDTWPRLRNLVLREGTGDRRLRWGGLKAFVDGSLGSTTAWFHEPYRDARSTRGLITSDTARLRADIRDADRVGLRIAVHAIGDRANDWLLDTYEQVIRENGPRDRRFRIEHAQHLTPAALPRFAQLGVLPSMQPYHAIDDGRWAEKRIGPDRIKRTYAFRSLLDAKANLMFGSDWTVAPISPLLGIFAAVTRRTLDDRNPRGWVPEEKITVEEALRAYTYANAYGAFLENDLGTLQEGKRADLVVLSENLLNVDPLRIPSIRVDYTVVDGRVVYQRSVR
jgi:predicted amidohydrolase YtcJ